MVDVGIKNSLHSFKRAFMFQSKLDPCIYYYKYYKYVCVYHYMWMIYYTKTKVNEDFL